MGKILVSGLLNLETTAKIRGFPINYYPIDFDFFGVNSTLSGVAYHSRRYSRSDIAGRQGSDRQNVYRGNR